MKLELRHKLALGAVFSLAVLAGSEPYWAQDVQGATQALKNMDLTPTKVGATSFGDYPFFTCPSSTYSTKFEAATKDGKTVSGIYCSGPIFKSTGIEFKK